jgi:hypothetical protein
MVGDFHLPTPCSTASPGDYCSSNGLMRRSRLETNSRKVAVNPEVYIYRAIIFEISDVLSTIGYKIKNLNP